MSELVSVSIGGKRFEYWEKIRISKAVDNIDTVELSAPFDPNQPEFRAAFRPFSYQPFEATINDFPFFTGTLAVVGPEMDLERTSAPVGAYSLPGVLGDCTPPADALPLEYKARTLQEIAEDLCAPFDIAVDFRNEAGPPFKKLKLDPGQQVMPFLVGLAAQRNLVISSDELGSLVFHTPATSGSAVAKLTAGAGPLVGVTPNFSIGSYYSEITGLMPVRVRSKKSVQFTARNTLLPDVYRPYMYSVDDVQDGEIEPAVTAKLGRMLGNSIGYSVAVSTWRDANGALWEPNTFVSLEAPRVMIYKPYSFLIRSVTFRKDASAESAELELILPGSFSGELPGALPWDE